jgi:hypothetical protein
VNDYMKIRELLDLLRQRQRAEVGDLRREICHQGMVGSV